MKPGFLIHYKGEHDFRFCPIDKDIVDNTHLWMDRIPVNKHENFILMFVEPFAYSKETSSRLAMARAAAASRWSAEVTATKAAAARKEFEMTGKIPGGIFLTGSGKKIWISHYDLKELLKETS